MSTNAGDLHLAFDVVLRASNAKYGSSEQSLAFSMSFSLFILFFQLVHWFEGIQDSVVCLKFYILANS